MEILGRQQLTDVWSGHLSGLKNGYWITLNSKKRVNHILDSSVHGKLSTFAGQVEQYIGELNEYCYGRQYLKRQPGARLTCVVGYEVGTQDGMIHAHIVAAHDGSTNRTVSEVDQFTQRKWSRFYKFDGSDKFTDVANLDDVRDRVWYLAKQSVLFQRVHGELNVTLH